MLGLAILFGLAVWVLLTLIAMIVGYKFGKGKGLFVGFMLTMGGWFVYWARVRLYSSQSKLFMQKRSRD
ncbi:hypothetical protein [Conchiformibius kuhniae]|uniref:Uncharacterized protein n=1 Tax=Conchiformibius kuhniae TaxID=211502 RepID=A0ABD8B772_9NEIS|nr:hypothetical protein [Conchiformibius kuhniae]